MSRRETTAENRARVGAHRRLSTPVAKDRYRRRWRARHSRFDERVRKPLRLARMERFGLDVTGDVATVANERRILRNARKRERAVAR